MIKTIISIVTIISVSLLIILLDITTPVTAGPLGILAIFIFAYLSLLGIITYFLYIASRMFSRLFSAFIPRKPIEQLSFRRSYYYSTVIAFAPILLLSIRSVGTVSIYEVLLITIFIIIGCLYVSKRIN
jgi:hypothetical protein